MEEDMKCWIATDKSGFKYLHTECPGRIDEGFWYSNDGLSICLGDVDFKNDKLNNQTWEDDPIQIELDCIKDLECKIVEKEE